MEGQARQGRAVLGPAAQLRPPRPPFSPALDGLDRDRPPRDPPHRLLLAALSFAILYALCVPAVFLLVMTIFTWELLRWLLFSVMLVPFLLGLGLLGLLKGLAPTGLLIGAIAARTPDRHWPKLLVAATVPLVDLLLLRASTLPRLVERGGLLLMDHRALFVLDTVAPLAASLLVAAAIPQRLVRRMLGRRRSR